MPTRIEFDKSLTAEVTLVWDAEGLMITFGNLIPTQCGAWGVIVNALRNEAKREQHA